MLVCPSALVPFSVKSDARNILEINEKKSFYIFFASLMINMKWREFPPLVRLILKLEYEFDTLTPLSRTSHWKFGC